jgi:hypothetical protein
LTEAYIKKSGSRDGKILASSFIRTMTHDPVSVARRGEAMWTQQKVTTDTACQQRVNIRADLLKDN